jgi:hypothetical protein
MSDPCAGLTGEERDRCRIIYNQDPGWSSARSPEEARAQRLRALKEWVSEDAESLLESIDIARGKAGG